MQFKQDKLRQLINDKGLTFSDVGRRMGKHPSALNGYVNGLRTPTVETLVEILTALDYQPGQIRLTTIGDWYVIADNGN